MAPHEVQDFAGNPEVRHVLEQLPRRQQAVAKPMLGAIAYAPDPGGGGAEAQGARGLVPPARVRETGGGAGAGLPSGW